MGQKVGVREIISDAGSKLRAADREMKNWRLFWKQNKLNQYGSNNGLDWKFIMPNSHHQNGASEVLIKLVKDAKQSMLKSV